MEEWMGFANTGTRGGGNTQIGTTRPQYTFISATSFLL